MFFVSVASKGLSQTVSLLFATLAGRCISVAGKGFTQAKKVTIWDGKILVELEGPLGGRVPVRKPGCKRRTLFAGHGEIVPT